jgi:hypothetical protein
MITQRCKLQPRAQDHALSIDQIRPKPDHPGLFEVTRVHCRLFGKRLFFGRLPNMMGSELLIK